MVVPYRMKTREISVWSYTFRGIYGENVYNTVASIEKEDVLANFIVLSASVSFFFSHPFFIFNRQVDYTNKALSPIIYLVVTEPIRVKNKQFYLYMRESIKTFSFKMILIHITVC